MPRRNDRASTKRNRPRQQAQQGFDFPRQNHTVAPVDIAKIVIPSGKCGTKLRFDTKQDAEVALKQAQINRKRFGNVGQERRVYACDRCPGFHLTSRETYEKRPH